MPNTKSVTLRDEHTGREHRHLIAYLDDAGNLHLDGHDSGPSLERLFGDDEVEWFRTIAAEHIPAALEALGGKPTDDILELLKRNWSAANSHALESTLEDAGIPMTYYSV